MVDGKNQVVGADIDMAQAIADELGVKLEISSMSFDNVLTSLQTGKADLAIAGISATDERKEVFDFSIPYYENKMSFLVRKADLDKYKDLSNLASANIAAQKGTVPETMVKEQLPNAQLTSLTNKMCIRDRDYAAASILGESLGYRLLTVSGEPADFKTRQPVMMVPIEMQDEIQSYIYERKKN